MKTNGKKFFAALLIATMVVLLAMPFCALAADGASAAETAQASASAKAIAAGIAIGLAASTGAIAMGLAVAKSAEGISRQPESEGKIRTTLMLGLVFVETAIIYALIVAILIIFVL